MRTPPVILIRPARRLCAFCLEPARTEVDMGPLRFAICIECADVLMIALGQLIDKDSY